MQPSSIRPDSINRAQKALESYKKIVEGLHQTIKNTKGEVPHQEISEAIEAIKNTRSEIESHGGKIAISKIPNAGLRTNTLNALRELRTTLDKTKPAAGMQKAPIHKLYAEIGLSEELLEDKNKKNSETVSEKENTHSMQQNSVRPDSHSRVEKSLESFKKTVDGLHQTIKQKKEEVSYQEISEAINTLRNIRSEIESQGGKSSISKIPNAGLRTNTLNALRELRTTLDRTKSVIESATQQVPLKKLYEEIGLSEELFEEKTKEKFETVSETEGSDSLGGNL